MPVDVSKNGKNRISVIKSLHLKGNTPAQIKSALICLFFDDGTRL